MRNRTIILAALVVAGIAGLPVLPTVQAQDGAATQPAQQERPPIYDEQADAREQINEAIAKAGKENRRVLVQWGATWCGWCHLLHDAMKENSELARKVLYEYDIVRVDVGRFDKNLDVAEEYGADFKSKGIPYLTVLDGKGNVIVNQETGSLEDPAAESPSHDVKKVLAFLTEHQAAPLSAESVLADGIAQAKKQDKLVFLHFGAPWCGWCHRLEDWMALDAVAPVLGKQFVDVKVDTDRMIGGQDLLQKHTGGKSSGIPFFVLLDGEGQVVVNSFQMPDGGNVGCPWTDEEKAIFAGLLKEHTGIPHEDIEKIMALIGPQEEAGG